ncbi:MAG: hypothetical protein IID58_12540 [Proteobacteria bacterium]|nr:hypothetical protein [Pseudomonadota bacterium]
MNNKSLSRILSIFASLAMLLIAFVGVSASAAGLGNTKQFAVKMNMVSDHGEMQGQEIIMTFYVGKNRIRAEMGAGAMEGMPGGIAFIVSDQRTAY